jgi:chloramphenicol 3-O-phosphotransferase
MKRLILLHGQPRSGKSSLATDLEKDYSFEKLTLDELYVEFIETRCKEYYFERLRNYIRQHYHCILDANGYTKDKCGRDLVKEWHEFLFAATSEKIQRYDNVVVEGYLLVDCLDELKARMEKLAEVFPIPIGSNNPLTTKDIIALLGQKS